MKKVRFLMLSAVAALCLTGCVNPSPAKSSESAPVVSSSRVIEDYEDDGSEHKVPTNIYNSYGQDASTQLVVQWHNEVGSTNQRVQITTEDDEDFVYAHNVEGDRRNFSVEAKTIGNYPDRDIFRAAIDNLEPNTKYIYRVGADGAWSDTYYHLTAEGERGAEFSFTVASDPQHAEHVSMRRTFNAANEYDPEHRFFFNCGDLVNYIGAEPGEIADYMSVASEFNKYKIIGATQGNHDTYHNEPGMNNYIFGEATVFNAYIANPGNGFEENVNKSNSYFYIYNGLLFISLNTLIEDNSYTAQTTWLREVLDTYADDVDFIVTTMHIGPFGGREGDKWKEKIVRDNFTPIFAEYKVDLALNGHDHAYNRSNAMVLDHSYTSDQLKTFDTTPDPDNGTIFSMVGATGPKFYDIATKAYESNIWKVREKADPGTFINLHVTGEELEVKAFRLKGSSGSDVEEIDTYTIAKKDR